MLGRIKRARALDSPVAIHFCTTSTLAALEDAVCLSSEARRSPGSRLVESGGRLQGARKPCARKKSDARHEIAVGCDVAYCYTEPTIM